MTRDQKIALRLKAHNVLMNANMEKGYTKSEASKKAFEGIRQIQKDVQVAFLQKIVAGDSELIDLFRWPVQPPVGGAL